MNRILLLLVGVDAIGTMIGIGAMRSRAVRGKFKAISAGVMVGVALFWIVPDLMHKSGVVHAALIIGVGLAALCGIDRFVYPVCPCCTHHGHRDFGIRDSPGHSHQSGGALIPLVLAICVHNLFDGWTAAVASAAGASAGSGIGVCLIAHKIPEAIVFGLMLRNAARRNYVAVLNACLASVTILVGGTARSSLPALSETTVVSTSLAFACSSFLFAGAHIFLRQQRSEGMRSALGPLLLGLFASAAMEQAISTVLAP
jgi:zinc transporter ZupT